MRDEVHELLSSEARRWRDSLDPNPSLTDLLPTRKHKVRPAILVAVIMLVALASGLSAFLLVRGQAGTTVQRTASCVPSVLSTQPGQGPYDPGTEPSIGRVARQQEVKLYGRDYFSSCQDTITHVGPTSDSTSQPPRPMTTVTISLLSTGGYSRELVTVSVGNDGSFTAVPRIPDDAPIGPGAIADNVGHKLPITIVVQ